MRIRPFAIALPCAVLALAVTVAGLVAVTHDSAGVSAAPARGGTSTLIDHNSLTGAIQLAQIRLRTLPKDDQTWAQLGSAYVQQARITVDPSYYPKAEGALKQSLALKPAANIVAFVGAGSLANARHEFTVALAWGRRAVAADPYNAGAYAVVNDALTQLGEYPAAQAAAQKMLDLQPGLSSFSRASYVFEEQGLVPQARSAMQQALASSSEPADIAFCRYYLGELAFNNGDPAAALQQYQLGLRAQSSYDPLLAGRAKAEAALGRTTDALHDYATVVERVPQPEYILEYGELLQSIGRPQLAAAQYTLMASIQQLFAANGVVDDLTSAVFEADHGSATAAVTSAQKEWGRRHSVLVADALAWALHRAGRDGEALHYATVANGLGWHNATFAYHQGMIELSLRMRGQARRDLTRALQINPHFSVLQAPLAAAALANLGGAR
jgi:tetratricopeptide (TPR) repeat protein